MGVQPIEGPNNSTAAINQNNLVKVAQGSAPLLPNKIDSSPNNDQLNQNLHQVPEEKSKSRLEELKQDLQYSKLSTWMMYITTALSAILPGNISRGFELPGLNKQNSLIAKIQDLFLRFRMMGHFTMHADTGSKSTLADDIPICNLHNIPAYKLGQASYKFHAFWSIPSWILQNFFFTGKHPLSKLPNTLLRIFDRTMRFGTNMFWNLRRITLGLLPYFNGDLISNPNSHAYQKLKEVSKPIRALMSSATALTFTAIHQNLSKWLPRPLMNILEKKFGFNIHRFRRIQEKGGVSASQEKSIPEILSELINISRENFMNNIKAFKENKHKSIITGEVQDIKREEPNTPDWYIKSKLLASLANPIVGAGSTIVNALGAVSGALGEALRGRTNFFLNMSQNLMDSASGAMSLIYMLGEVFNHAASFQVGQRNGEIRTANLYTFAVGFLGMGWRMIKGAAAALAIPGAFFKPLGNFCNKLLHSRLNNILDPLFLLFFSINRTLTFKKSAQSEASTAGHAERKAAEKYDSILGTLGLIPRIIMHDSKVSYAHPEAIARAEGLAS